MENNLSNLLFVCQRIRSIKLYIYGIFTHYHGVTSIPGNIENLQAICSSCRKEIALEPHASDNAENQCRCIYESPQKDFYVYSCGQNNCPTYYTNRKLFGSRIYLCDCQSQSKRVYTFTNCNFVGVTENTFKRYKKDKNNSYAETKINSCSNRIDRVDMWHVWQRHHEDDNEERNLRTEMQLKMRNEKNTLTKTKEQPSCGVCNFEVQQQETRKPKSKIEQTKISTNSGMKHIEKIENIRRRKQPLTYHIECNSSTDSLTTRLQQRSRLVSLRQVKNVNCPRVRVSSKALLTELVDEFFKDYTLKRSSKDVESLDLKFDYLNGEYLLRYPLILEPGQEMDMSKYFNRLWSFSTWPLDVNISAIRLAAAGFFYTLIGQTVKCFSCKITIPEWSIGAEPLQVHEQLSPTCEFIRIKKEEINVDNENTTNQTASIGFLEQASAVRTPSANETQALIDEITSKFQQTVQVKMFDIEQKQRYATPQVETSMTTSTQKSVHNNSVEKTVGSSFQQNMPSIQAEQQTTLITQCTEDTRDEIQPDMCDHTQSQRENPSYQYLSMQPNIGQHISIEIPTDDLSTERSHLQNAKHPQFASVRNRLESYNNWSYHNIQHPQRLVEAGFYHVGRLDIVRCFYCDIGLAEWDVDDDPWVEHARHSPQCLFLRDKKGDNFVTVIQESWRQIYSPKHPQFEDYHARLQTFECWPSDATQRPEQLTTAGFFYTGADDTVRCHYCDGGLRQWERYDNPWIEHARWFPFCKYVVKIKGIAYIEEVARTYDEIHSQTATASGVEGGHFASEYGMGDENNKQEQVHGNALLMPASKSILDMGYNTNILKMAINEHIKQTGLRDFTAENLLEIIQNKDEKELPSDDNTTSLETLSNIGLQDIQRIDTEELSTEELRIVNKKIKDNVFLCKRCKKKERNVMFLPCGHRDTCETCSQELWICTTCNNFIDKRVKTFLS